MSALRKFTPAFLSLIDEASRKCFGHLSPATADRAGNRLLRTKPLGPLVIKHYPNPQNTEGVWKDITNGFMTEQQLRRMNTLGRLKRRGKGPPKKGQGKRTTKK
jgi:small subunit ribosomal protein S33